MRYNKFLDSKMDKILFSNNVVRKDIEEISAEFTFWNKFNNQTILITGANGHIASYIAYTFAFQIINRGLNAKLLLLSRNFDKLKKRFGHLISPNIKLIVHDISEELDFNEHIDFIYHFAGNASPYYIKTDPVGIMRANIIGTMNVAELARTNGSKIIFSSSREVYGQTEGLALLKEEDFGKVELLDARSCYPESKRAAEAILNSYRLQYNVPFVIARIAHCYGPEMKIGNDGRVMQDFISNAVNNEDIIIKSDGQALRAFCYITDVISCLLILSINGVIGEAYNISNEDEEITIAELANKIASITGNINVQLKGSDSDSSLYCSYKRVGLNCSKAKRLGWNPRIGLESGLTKTIMSFKQ